VLPDVRERNEFPTSHIRGAINLPLSEIQTVSFQIDTPLYVYCLRGSRSKRAAAYLKKAGYSDVCSIGGILAWKGEKVR
jgi:rhodanese-related sulfurtransferase